VLEFLLLLVCASILASGVLAVCLNNLMAAMVSAGLASLFAAVSFLLLAAPDVAMAEAAIGSGLATFIFLYAIRKTGNGRDEDGKPDGKPASGKVTGKVAGKPGGKADRARGGA
jgi:energy-converting hydrogenase B subunit D